MDIFVFIKKQLLWARKYTASHVDQARMDWWIKKLGELAKQEAEVFPAAGATPVEKAPVEPSAAA